MNLGKLKKLTEDISRVRENAKTKKPLPRIDDTVPRVVDAIEQAHKESNRETIAVLQKLVDKEISVELDAAAIGEAIGKEIRKMPVPQIVMPERKPISYEATVTSRDRNKNIVSARIDPITE